MIKKLLLVFVFLTCILPQGYSFADENGAIIVVKKATNELAYYENGNQIMKFRVATGKSQQVTPEGTFKLVTKKENPSYLPGRIPGGSPKNPLGYRWLGFDYGNTNGHVYGIHGTNNEGIIGSYVTIGNVSMRNEDINWLYRKASEGTKIIITSSTQSFDYIIGKRPTPAPPPEQKPVIPPITLYIDGVRQEPSDKPFIKDDRTFVPLRYIFEKIGAKVEWNDKEKRIIATKEDKRLQLVIGSKLIRFNGINEEMDTAPFIVNDRTFVPLRAIFEYFDTEVEWDEETRSVHVTQIQKPPTTLYVNDVAQSIINRSSIIFNDNHEVEELLVPANYLFDKFGATTTYAPNEKKLTITRNEQIVEFIMDSKQMRINGKIELLEHTPTFKDGEVLVPLKITERLFGAIQRIQNNSEEMTVDIDFELTNLSKIYFNQNLRLPYTGFIVDRINYLPLSLVFIELGGEINVTDDDQIEMIREGTLIQMHIDSKSAFVNGRLINMEHPPRRMDGQVIVPLDFVVKTLGGIVDYRANHQIFISQ